MVNDGRKGVYMGSKSQGVVERGGREEWDEKFLERKGVYLKG